MNRCTKCGQVFLPDHQFCGRCGEPVIVSAELAPRLPVGGSSSQLPKPPRLDARPARSFGLVGALIGSLFKNAVFTVILVVLASLAWMLHPQVGIAVVLLGSCLHLLLAYRMDWPMNLATCGLPVLTVTIGFVSQLTAYTPLISGDKEFHIMVYILAGLGGAIIGGLRGSTHKIYLSQGRVISKHAMFFLMVWVACFAATHVLIFLGLDGPAVFFLAGQSMMVALIAVSSLILFWRYRRLRRQARVPATAWAMAIGFLLISAIDLGNQMTADEYRWPYIRSVNIQPSPSEPPVAIADPNRANRHRVWFVPLAEQGGLIILQFEKPAADEVTWRIRDMRESRLPGRDVDLEFTTNNLQHDLTDGRPNALLLAWEYADPIQSSEYRGALTRLEFVELYRERYVLYFTFDWEPQPVSELLTQTQSTRFALMSLAEAMSPSAADTSVAKLDRLGAALGQRLRELTRLPEFRDLSYSLRQSVTQLLESDFSTLDRAQAYSTLLDTIRIVDQELQQIATSRGLRFNSQSARDMLFEVEGVAKKAADWWEQNSLEFPEFGVDLGTARDFRPDPWKDYKPSEKTSAESAQADLATRRSAIVLAIAMILCGAGIRSSIAAANARFGTALTAAEVIASKKQIAATPASAVSPEFRELKNLMGRKEALAKKWNDIKRLAKDVAAAKSDVNREAREIQRRYQRKFDRQLQPLLQQIKQFEDHAKKLVDQVDRMKSRLWWRRLNFENIPLARKAAFKISALAAIIAYGVNLVSSLWGGARMAWNRPAQLDFKEAFASGFDKARAGTGPSLSILSDVGGIAGGLYVITEKPKPVPVRDWWKFYRYTQKSINRLKAQRGLYQQQIRDVHGKIYQMKLASDSAARQEIKSTMDYQHLQSLRTELKSELDSYQLNKRALNDEFKMLTIVK